MVKTQLGILRSNSKLLGSGKLGYQWLDLHRHVRVPGSWLRLGLGSAPVGIWGSTLTGERWLCLSAFQINKILKKK